MTQEEFLKAVVEKYRHQGLPNHLIEEAAEDDWTARYGSRLKSKFKTILKRVL